MTDSARVRGRAGLSRAEPGQAESGRACLLAVKTTSDAKHTHTHTHKHTGLRDGEGGKGRGKEGGGLLRCCCKSDALMRGVI